MYPIYPNCFDVLTTNGIITEDLVGYVTGTPSVYLQNYVAQRGGVPSLPGQPLPDPLPNVPLQRTPVSDTYQTPEKTIYPPVNTVDDKNAKWNTAKKVLTGLFLGGLAVLGVVKGKDLYNKLKNFSANGNSVLNSIGNWFKNIGTKIKDGFKKIFKPQPQPQQSVPWYTKIIDSIKNLFKTKP